MILRRRHKRLAERSAREAWNHACTMDLSPNQRYLYARRRAEEDLLNRRREFGNGEVGSVVTSLLLSLAIKFATKLLLRWLEEEFLGRES